MKGFEVKGRKVKLSLIIYIVGRSLQMLGMVLVLYVAIFFSMEPNMRLLLNILLSGVVLFAAGWFIVRRPWFAK